MIINGNKNGLYRYYEDSKFRFFRVYTNQSKILKIKEYKDGNLHIVINKYEGEEAIEFLKSIENKLQFWQ